VASPSAKSIACHRISVPLRTPSRRPSY
jgi:hypothetical protein